MPWPDSYPGDLAMPLLGHVAMLKRFCANANA